MKVSDATIEIRPRTGGEIIDLSILFYRAYFLLFFGLAMGLGGPCVIVAMGIHHLTGVPWIGLLFFVLMLSLSSGAIILAASRIVFGTPMTIGTTLSQYKNIWPAFFFRRFVQNLLSIALMPILVGYIMKLSTAFYPMVTLLEQLKGRDRNVRNRGLGRRGGGNLFAFDCLLFLVTGMFVVAIIALLELMLGEVFTLWAETGLRSEDALYDPLRFGIWLLCILVVSPIYTLGWFFRYLDARIRGEGWDLELGFKRVASRLSEAAAVKK